MERDLSQSTAYCRSGCGFYGSPATDGLCSKCYKDAVMRKQTVPSPSAVASSTSLDSSSSVNNNPPASSLLPSKPPMSVSPTSIIETSLNTATPTVPSPCSQVKSHNDNLCEGLEASGPSDLLQAASVNATTIASGLNDNVEPPPTEGKKKKNRCTKCKVKIGVIGFPCRCGGNFCAQHRYANEHDCNFDYREHGQEEIRKNNPQVVGEKIQKI